MLLVCFEVILHRLGCDIPKVLSRITKIAMLSNPTYYKSVMGIILLSDCKRHMLTTFYNLRYSEQQNLPSCFFVICFFCICSYIFLSCSVFCLCALWLPAWARARAPHGHLGLIHVLGSGVSSQRVHKAK